MVVNEPFVGADPCVRPSLEAVMSLDRRQFLLSAAALAALPGAFQPRQRPGSMAAATLANEKNRAALAERDAFALRLAQA